MGIGWLDLPVELKLGIVRSLPKHNILSFALLNKECFGLRVEILLEQAGTTKSRDAVYSLCKAIVGIERLGTWTNVGRLTDLFVGHVHTQVITAISIKQPAFAKSMLKFLTHEMFSSKIYVDYFVSIVTTVRANIIYAVNNPDKEKLSIATLNLGVLRACIEISPPQEMCCICGDHMFKFGSDTSECCITVATWRNFGIVSSHSKDVPSSGTYTGPNLEKTFPFSWYKYLEDEEVIHGSRWRRNYLYDLKTWLLIADDKNLRYFEWLNIHKHTLHTLQGLFQTTLGMTGDNVCGYLAKLWAFLPVGKPDMGISRDEQVLLVKRTTETTTIQELKEIDSFLSRLVDAYAEAHAVRLRRQIYFDCGSITSTFPKLCRSRLRRKLLKWLLLQIPLLSWPTIFIDGRSGEIDSSYHNFKVFERPETFYVEGNKTHPDSLDVLFLWNRLLDSEPDPFANWKDYRNKLCEHHVDKS